MLELNLDLTKLCYQNPSCHQNKNITLVFPTHEYSWAQSSSNSFSKQVTHEAQVPVEPGKQVIVCQVIETYTHTKTLVVHDKPTQYIYNIIYNNIFIVHLSLQQQCFQLKTIRVFNQLINATSEQCSTDFCTVTAKSCQPLDFLEGKQIVKK